MSRTRSVREQVSDKTLNKRKFNFLTIKQKIDNFILVLIFPLILYTNQCSWHGSPLTVSQGGQNFQWGPGGGRK